MKKLCEIFFSTTINLLSHRLLQQKVMLMLVAPEQPQTYFGVFLHLVNNIRWHYFVSYIFRCGCKKLPKSFPGSENSPSTSSLWPLGNRDVNETRLTQDSKKNLNLENYISRSSRLVIAIPVLNSQSRDPGLRNL